jgi:hypothetical protein
MMVHAYNPSYVEGGGLWFKSSPGNNIDPIQKKTKAERHLARKPWVQMPPWEKNNYKKKSKGSEVVML